jgi:hypothetical protein
VYDERMLALSAAIVCLSAQASSPKTAAHAAITSIKIERTPCFGRCPVYKASLLPDGTVQYFGERFVPKLGNWRAKIGDSDFKRLSRLSEKLGFFNLKNNYSRPVTDLPTTIITITRGTKVKSVSCYGQEPDEFWILSVAIDSVLKESESSWEKAGIKK